MLSLKQLIDAHTVTHEILATRIGVSPSALSLWYQGKRKLSAHTADQIAKAFGVKAVIVNGNIRFERKS